MDYSNSFGFGSDFTTNQAAFTSNVMGFNGMPSTPSPWSAVQAFSPWMHEDEPPVAFLSVENTRQEPFDSEDRQVVAKETLDILTRRGYRFSDGHEVAIDSKAMQGSARIFQRQQFNTTPFMARNFPRMAICVLNQDTITALFNASITYRRQNNDPHYKPCGMVLCNGKNPGGGFLVGDGAQEEDCCHRTDLIVGIDPKYNSKSAYPLPHDGGISVRGVTIFRKGAASAYALLRQDELVKADLIGTCAFDLRSGSSDREKLQLPATGALSIETLQNNSEYMQGTWKKIVAWFQEAESLECLDVFPGALGCGVYGNPSEIIARLFRDVVDSYCRGRFRSITFTIFSKSNDDYNFQVFQQAFPVLT
jgi:uncharacterized protein (TIGR02452 family)